MAIVFLDLLGDGLGRCDVLGPFECECKKRSWAIEKQASTTTILQFLSGSWKPVTLLLNSTSTPDDHKHEKDANPEKIVSTSVYHSIRITLVVLINIHILLLISTHIRPPHDALPNPNTRRHRGCARSRRRPGGRRE